MNRPIVVSLALASLLALPACRHRPRAPSEDPDIAVFRAAAERYVAEAEALASKLPKAATPDEVKQSESGLAKSLAEARADAKPGDILNPEFAKRVRLLVRDSMHGVEGQATRESAKEEGDETGTVELRVNAPYPDSATLLTMPATLLQALPALPAGLEYRFVRRHLILRGVKANVIADYLENVLPPTTKKGKK